VFESVKEEVAAARAADGGAAAIGRAFERVGRIGFWVQVMVAIGPIAVVAIVFGAVRGFGLPGGRMDLLGWLSLLSLLVLLFTTYWSRRYIHRGRALVAGGPAEPEALGRMVWTGLTASAVGILFSIIVMTAEIVFLLVVFLEAPQGGAPVFQTLDGGGLPWISAVDLLSLLTLILTVAAEIVVLLLALWLLFRVSRMATA